MNSEITFLLLTLLALFLLATFFSMSETGMLSINRYRLKHLAKISKGAKMVQTLLQRPDRLIGVILLGGTFVNILASAVGTQIAVHFLGEKWGVIVSSVVLTLFILTFCEVTPKTLAVLYPEKVAIPSAYILNAMLKILYPLIWMVNMVSNNLLRLSGIPLNQSENMGISPEELRALVHETTGRIPSKHRIMLLSILDLEKVTVDDIMVPRHEVVGIDLNNEWMSTVGQLANTQHTFLPVYDQDLNNLIGIIHAKKVLHLMADNDFDEQKLRSALDEASFVPKGCSLTKQLINFQKTKERFALVVDEYGDIQGLITLEDILEEIVGEFTTNMSATYTPVLPQEDGSFLVDGGLSIRECNRMLEWKLPTQGPKTVNGLIIEHLQMIPEVGTCCLIGNIPIEVLQVQDNRVKIAKILPPILRFTPITDKHED